MFDETAAVAVCHDVVNANRKLFDAFADLSEEDLMQVAMQAAWKADAKFLPGRGASWKTWISRWAKARLIDLYRSKDSQRRTHIKHLATFGDPGDAQEAVKNLCSSLEAVAERAVDAAENMLPPYSSKFSPRRFTLPQLAACLLLREHLNTSFRGVEMVLRQSASVRDRMGLTRVPSYATLAIASRTIRRKVGQMRKMKHGKPLYRHDHRADLDADDAQVSLAPGTAQ